MSFSRLMLLYQIAHQVELATTAAGKHNPNALLTLPDLVRLLNADREVLKKALRVLHDYGLICSIGLNPKHYRFDSYRFKTLLSQPPESEELETLLTWLCDGPPEDAIEPTPPEYRRKRKRF